MRPFVGLVTVIGLATGPSEAAEVSLSPFVAVAANVRLERPPEEPETAPERSGT